MAYKSRPRRSLSELTRAIREKRWDDVSEMCKAQPDLNTVTKDRENSLEAVRREAPEEILVQMMKHANENTINRRFILHRLAFLGYTLALARALGISNHNINMQNWSGFTPLHWLLMNSELTYEKHKEMTKILLDSGANF